MTGTTDDDRTECVGAAMDLSTDLTARYLTDRSAISAATAHLLNRVARGGPARLTVLATKEGVSQPSMTQLIQRLERQALVARLADPADGRVALVSITEGGRALLDDSQQVRRERLAKLMATLPPEDADNLWLAAKVAIPILARLAKNAESSNAKSVESPKAAPGRRAGR